MSKKAEFEWEQWNLQKNEEKRGVSRLEAESAFYDDEYSLFDDVMHAGTEKRFVL
jgi:uncharacterized DUF497 family protein